VHLDDPFHDRKPCTSPFALRVHLIEEFEDLLMLTLVDANPVILDEEDRLSSVLTMTNLVFGSGWSPRYLTLFPKAPTLYMVTLIFGPPKAISPPARSAPEHNVSIPQPSKRRLNEPNLT